MTVEAIRGDITRARVDAIVNAANSGLHRGGGVCGAIFAAAGPELDDACAAIGHCATGDAVVTSGFALAARWIVHTVGPVWHGGGRDEPALLASCYRRSIEVAAGTGTRSLAFPAISTGIFGYPAGPAAEIAVATVTAHAGALDVVRLVAFDPGTLALYRELLGVIDVPAIVRAKATAAGASDWVEGLPDLVADLEHDWSITVGRTFTDATEAFVAEAMRADWSPAVLKILVPRHSAAAPDEITVLRLCEGEGCARLYESDAERGALLIERLGPSLHDVGRPIEVRHAILCTLAQRVWRPAPGSGLRTGAQKGRWLAEYIAEQWQRLDRPCSERAVAYALACAERRVVAHDDERAVLVHGDIHEWNALQAGDGWKLVDPDGLLAEPEYDLGILMREDPLDLLAGDPWDRAHALARRTGGDPVATWEWGVVERVSTGLLGTEIGMQPVARQMLHAADVIADASDR